jgi:hypothetical protein
LPLILLDAAEIENKSLITTAQLSQSTSRVEKSNKEETKKKNLGLVRFTGNEHLEKNPDQYTLNSSGLIPGLTTHLVEDYSVGCLPLFQQIIICHVIWYIKARK